MTDREERGLADRARAGWIAPACASRRCDVPTQRSDVGEIAPGTAPGGDRAVGGALPSPAEPCGKRSASCEQEGLVEAVGARPAEGPHPDDRRDPPRCSRCARRSRGSPPVLLVPASRIASAVVAQLPRPAARRPSPRTGSIGELVEIDLEFHRPLCALTGNAARWSTTGNRWPGPIRHVDHVRRPRPRGFQHVGPHRHQSILVDAVANGDAERARGHRTDHMVERRDHRRRPTAVDIRHRIA